MTFLKYSICFCERRVHYSGGDIFLSDLRRAFVYYSVWDDIIIIMNSQSDSKSNRNAIKVNTTLFS